MRYLWQAIWAWFVDWIVPKWQKLRARSTGDR